MTSTLARYTPPGWTVELMAGTHPPHCHDVYAAHRDRGERQVQVIEHEPGALYEVVRYDGDKRSRVGTFQARDLAFAAGNSALGYGGRKKSPQVAGGDSR